MHRAAWSVDEAQEHLKDVVKAAEQGKPQMVMSDGHPAVYIVSAEQYESWVSAGASDNRDFVQHLLSAPKAPPGVDVDELFARVPWVDRPPIDFED